MRNEFSEGTTGGAYGSVDPTTIKHSPWSDLGVACLCPACTGGVADPASDSVSASVDYLAGTVAANGKPIWSVEQIAAHLNRTGASWTPDPTHAPPAWRR